MVKLNMKKATKQRKKLKYLAFLKKKKMQTKNIFFFIKFCQLLRITVLLVFIDPTG